MKKSFDTLVAFRYFPRPHGEFGTRKRSEKLWKSAAQPDGREKVSFEDPPS